MEAAEGQICQLPLSRQGLYNSIGFFWMEIIGSTNHDNEKEYITMTYYICVTCGTQFPESESPPSSCPICSDQRQYIGQSGQQWTTLAEMQAKGMHNKLKEYEPGLTGIGTEPSFAIGQRALLVQTDKGNILWDCITYLDDETIAAIHQRGGLRAIAISHPHFYTTVCALQESDTVSGKLISACSAGRRTCIS